MRIRMKRSLLVFICSFISLMSIAQVTVEARLDTTHIMIGEQIQIRVKCNAGAKQKIEFPYFQSQQELTRGVEVVNNGRIDTLFFKEGGRIELERKYTITSFDSALYQIPPFKVNVDGKEYISRGKLGLKVSTVAVDTVHVDKFNGPFDVVDLPFIWSWRTTLLSIIAIVLMLFCFVFIVRLSDPKLITHRIVILPPTPAHVTALNQIAQIKENIDTESKAYYMKLTETLRTYIEQRFGFSAKEMTTSQIIDELTATKKIDALNELREILITADLVKFAKHSTSLPEQESSLLQALNYVQTTKQKNEELPQPRVEYETLSMRNQHRLRIAMIITSWVLGFISLGIITYIIVDLYCCYGI